MINKKAIIFLLLLSGGCTRELITSEERKAVDALCQSYNSDNWETRRDAITHVCSYDLPRVREVLVTALNDTHSGVRIEALKCIGEMKIAEAKRKVRNMADLEKNDNIRLYAIQALANYRDTFSAPVFAKGLQSNDWLIREASIKGMLMINDSLIQQTSVPYVMKALSDERMNVRLAALENVRIKDDKIYNEISAIISDPANTGRISLLKAALKAINGYLLDKITRAKIVDLLTHPDMDVRLLSLSILKKDKELQDKQLLRW